MILATVWYAEREVWQNGVERVARPRMDALDREAFIFDSRIRGRISDLFMLRNMSRDTLAEAPDSSGVTPAFRILAQSIMRARPIYDQVRILNPSGREVFRLNLHRENDATGYKIEDVPASEFQDKSSRPYFTNALLAAPGTAVLSHFDLNVEHQQIEMPQKPMVRFSTQISGPDGKLAGILVLNYLGDNLLRELELPTKTPDQTYILNHEGYWLIGPDKTENWAFMYPDRKDQSLAVTDPSLWQKLTSKPSGYFIYKGALYIHHSVDPIGSPMDYPAISMPTTGGESLRSTFVTVVPESMIAADTASTRKTLWIIGILTSIFVAPAIWFGVTAISRREEALRQARAAERAKAQFLAMMSHEIRTPMNGVLGFAEMLSEANLDPELHDYALTIRNTGESLLRIIDNILDFSRIEAAQMQIDRTAFSLPKILGEISTILSPRARKTGVELRTEIDPGIPENLIGDPGRLRQVLINLAGNSLKFTERGHVTIRAQLASTADGHEPLHIEFSVIDTGPGLSPQQLDRIFQPFMQADAGTARRHGGSGLGLAISRSLVELMGGAITAVSQEGTGSTFSFTLPLDASQERPAEEEAGITKLSSKFAVDHPMVILVADDDAVNLKLVTLVLRNLGYEAVTASSGPETIEKYEKTRPDCILLDVQMGEMDGNEAARRIRAIEERDGSPGHCYIAALSASIIPKERNLCFEAGMDDYLTKPLRRDALIEALARASRHRTLPPVRAVQ